MPDNKNDRQPGRPGQNQPGGGGANKPTKNPSQDREETGVGGRHPRDPNTGDPGRDPAKRPEDELDLDIDELDDKNDADRVTQRTPGAVPPSPTD